LRLARLRRFGASSERLSFQGTLFDEAELEVSLEEVETQLPEEEKRPAGKPRQADGYSERLPRIQVYLSLSEEEKAGASKTFYTKVKEELDIVPAQARGIEYWQEKAVFKDSEGGSQVKAAVRPVHPLGKCQASVQLLAWLLVAKYADALPLYRLEGILKGQPDLQGHAIHPEPVGTADRLLRRWTADYQQRPGGECHPTLCHRLPRALRLPALRVAAYRGGGDS
jgi:transposase